MLDGYSVVLNIDIETYQRPGPLLNEFVKEGVKIKSISIDEISKFVYDEDEEVEIVLLTKKELNTICYNEKKITLIEERSQFNKGFGKTFTNNKGFTVREMFNVIVEFEKETRPLSNWFGGVDAHHIYFEGFRKYQDKENTYTICWGS